MALYVHVRDVIGYGVVFLLLFFALAGSTQHSECSAQVEGTECWVSQATKEAVFSSWRHEAKYRCRQIVSLLEGLPVLKSA